MAGTAVKWDRPAFNFPVTQERSPWEDPRVRETCENLSQCPVFFSFFLFFLKGCTLGIWRFPGEGLNRSCSCWPTPQTQQREMGAGSVTYTTAHGNTRSLIHWERPGIKPATSWLLVGFVNHWATMGIPNKIYFYIIFLKGKCGEVPIMAQW